MDAVAEVSEKASLLNSLPGKAINEFHTGNHDSAIEYLQQIEDLYKDVKIKLPVYYGRGGNQIEHLYNDVLLSDKLYFDEKRKEIEKWRFTIFGFRCRQLEDFPCAIENAQKFLQIIKSEGDRKAEANVLSFIATYYDFYYRKQSIGYEEAFEYYNQAKACYSDLGDFSLAASMDFKIFFLMGFKLEKEEKLIEARKYYQESSKIAEDLKDKSLQELAWNGLMLNSLNINDLKSKIEYDKKLLELYRSTKENEKECIRLQSIASSYFTLGNYKTALAYYQNALNIAKENKNYPEEIKISMGIAEVFFKSGDYQKSMGYIQNVLENAKNTENKKAEANAYKLLGDLYAKLGDWEKSIDKSLHLIKIKDEIGDEENKSIIYRSIANCYRELMQKQGTVKKPEDDLFFKSIEYFKKALNEYQKLGDLNGEGDIYAEMLLLARGLPDRNIAIGYMQKAIQLHSEAKSTVNIMKDFYYTGTTYFVWGDDTQSLFYLQKGLELSRASGSIFWEYHFLKVIGSVYVMLKDFKSAAAIIRQALSLADNIGIMQKAITLGDLGWIAEKAGQYENAKHYLSESIKMMEQTRDIIMLEEIRMSYDSNTEKLLIYESMVNILIRTGEKDKAFEYLQRMKSRAFLDLLGSKMRLNKTKDKELCNEELELQWKINSLLEKIKKEQAQPKENQRSILNVWKEELSRSRNEYINLLLKIKLENPELSSLVSVDPLTLKDVQRLLDSDTTLLEYFVTQTKTILWVVDKSRVNVVEMPFLGKFLSFETNELKEQILNLSHGYKDHAEILYEILIEPAKPYIKTKKIAIVPHSTLHYLPFHALIVPDRKDRGSKTRIKPRFLIEEYDIFYLPSASVLKFIHEKRKGFTGKVLAFGNPYLGDQKLNLPFAEDEVKNIKSIYPETLFYLKKHATKERLVDLSGSYNVIHFASHGELNPSSPLFSNIRLAKEGSNDGRLEVHEIFNLNLENSTLVTLSACETGLGKLTNGDEYVGLTRAFIYAGTPSVVASLWKVNDQSTAELMKLFYRNLKTYPKSEALRKAQLEMIGGKTGKGIVRGVGGITANKAGVGHKKVQKTVDGSHPYFWAPFALYGDWK
jgi:CHAT domain-containing protein